MLEQSIKLTDPEGIQLFTYVWSPDQEIPIPIIGAVQIAHGMAEAAHRYKRFAETLTQAGYIVYANDHRGHGRTATDQESSLGFIGDDGFEWMVRDMNQVNQHIREEHPNLPIFLFGHSMGSFLTQRYMSLYGDSISGVILSGSNGKPISAIHAAIFLAKREMQKKGPKAPSTEQTKLTFGSYNKAFSPNRTAFDWLSRDEREVDQYIKDPMCGNVFPASFYYYFFKGLVEIAKSKHMRQIPKTLPILIVSGDQDPVGRFGKGVKQLFDTYRSFGLTDVSCKLYEGARHELLNETNREEVTAFVLDWILEKTKNQTRN